MGVTLASGKELEADLVVAADGINSTIAPLLLGGSDRCVRPLARTWRIHWIDHTPPQPINKGDAMDPTPVYSGYSIFFGVIEGFDPPKAPLPLPPPEATSLQAMMDHPAAIVQVC